MKKALRITAALLVTAMLALSLFSCGIVKGDTVMQYGDYKITEAMYSYWMSSFKSYFLYYYGTSGQYDQLWTQTLPDGRTYEQFFEDELVTPYAKKVLICQKLFDDYKLSFTDEIENTEMVSKAVSAGLMSGYADGSFGAGNTATRAEAATVISNYLKGSE